MWYVYDKSNKLIAHTEDEWYAAELKRAGFDVRERGANGIALEKKTSAV